MSDHKVPEEVKNDLKSFADEYNLPIEDVKKMFRDEYEKEYLSDYEEENGERAKQAAFIVKAELAASGKGDSSVLEGVVFSVSGVEEKEKKNKPGEFYKVCDIRGLFSEDPKKGFVMTRIRCFNDVALVAKNIPKNIPIKVNVSSDEYNGKVSYSMSNSLHYQVIESTKVGFNLRDFIRKAIKPRKEGESVVMKIEEVPYRLSEDDDDYKVLEGRVKRSGIKTSEKGFTYVSYTIYDDFRGTDEVMYVKVGLTDQVFDTGALIWVIGINKEPDGNYQNTAPSMFAETVVGMIPKTIDQDKYDAMIENAKKESESKKSGAKMAEKTVKDTDFSGLKKVAKDSKSMTELGGW